MAKKQNRRTSTKKHSTEVSASEAMKLRFAKLGQSLKWLFGLLAGAGLAALLLVSIVWLVGVDTKNILPLNKLEVTGQQYTQGQEIYQALQKLDDRGFFSIDMQQAEQVLLDLPWVKSVQLRKVWPETIRLKLVEHKPFAFWGANGVVAIDGTVLYPPVLPQEDWLALSGPDELAETLTELVQNFQQKLVNKKIVIASMSLSKRGAISLQLNDGLQVELGKNQVAKRLQRLIEQIDNIKAYKKLPLIYLDLRYENGLAARWNDVALNDTDKSNR